MTETVGIVAGVAFIAVLMDAAISDLRGFRIPNRDPLILTILFFFAAGLAGDLSDLLFHLTAGAALFAFGVALFAFGLWGGGDAKLVAAVGLWTGFAGMPRFVVMMALAGGVLAIAMLAAKALSRSLALSPWGERIARSNDLPYGIAIAVAGVDWMLTAMPPVGSL